MITEQSIKYFIPPLKSRRISLTSSLVPNQTTLLWRSDHHFQFRSSVEAQRFDFFGKSDRSSGQTLGLEAIPAQSSAFQHHPKGGFPQSLRQSQPTAQAYNLFNGLYAVLRGAPDCQFATLASAPHYRMSSVICQRLHTLFVFVFVPAPHQLVSLLLLLPSCVFFIIAISQFQKSATRLQRTRMYGRRLGLLAQCHRPIGKTDPH